MRGLWEGTSHLVGKQEFPTERHWPFRQAMMKQVLSGKNASELILMVFMPSITWLRYLFLFDVPRHQIEFHPYMGCVLKQMSERKKAIYLLLKIFQKEIIGRLCRKQPKYYQIAQWSSVSLYPKKENNRDESVIKNHKHKIGQGLGYMPSKVWRWTCKERYL